MKITTAEFTHTDARRKLTQLFTSNVAQVNEYEANRGAILGDHYHKDTYETFYVTRGTAKVTVDDAEFVATRGTLFTVFPNENHVVEVLSHKFNMFTFLSKPYTQENPDIWKSEKP